MRFMAFLLLAALAGALVCAQDATSEPTEATETTAAEDPTSPERERTPTEESASPQETDPAGQRIPAAVQWVAKVLSPRPALNALKAAVDRRLSQAQKVVEEAQRRVNERIQGGIDYFIRNA